MEDTYKITWLCKAKKAQKSFLFTDYVEEFDRGRMKFIDAQTDQVLTLQNDSYYWMITRPNKIYENNN